MSCIAATDEKGLQAGVQAKTVEIRRSLPVFQTSVRHSAIKLGSRRQTENLAA